MTPQYPETYMQKRGRNDVDAFRVALVRSFGFKFIACVAPQRAHAAVAIVRCGFAPFLSPKSQLAKIKELSIEVNISARFRGGTESKSGLKGQKYIRHVWFTQNDLRT